MREELVAWAEDCVVRGPAELPDGRWSDVVNSVDLFHLAPVRLESLEDDRVLELEELDLERRDLHLVRVDGRPGDPNRKLRPIREPVALQIGPFLVQGNLHRAPAAAPLASVTVMASRFVPLTEATFALRDGSRAEAADVLLVNRELITKAEPLDELPATDAIPVA